MKSSTYSASTPAALLRQMAPAARQRFASDASWAAACGLPRETLSRIKKSRSCGLKTLAALAEAAGCQLAALPRNAAGTGHMPESYSRDYEETLLNLCASGSTDATVWRACGPAFFAGGLAVLLASARGFDRERYLRLAEELHPGVSTPEVFALWLRKTPLRAARFLPMLRRKKAAS